MNANLLRDLMPMVFLAGILAGAFGIGGGIVINPVLLNYGFRQEKAFAIASVIIVFTSMTTSTQFLIAGAFNLEYASYVMLISIAGSYIGNTTFKNWINKLNRPSLLIWILAGLLLLSGVLLFITGISNIIQKGGIFRFGVPC